jgi:hypothetical protein
MKTMIRNIYGVGVFIVKERGTRRGKRRLREEEANHLLLSEKWGEVD